MLVNDLVCTTDSSEAKSTTTDSVHTSLSGLWGLAVTAISVEPNRAARRHASIVSVVSPDLEIATTVWARG